MPLPPDRAAEAALLLAISILVPCQESSRSQAGTHHVAVQIPGCAGTLGGSNNHHFPCKLPSISMYL